MASFVVMCYRHLISFVSLILPTNTTLVMACYNLIYIVISGVG